MVTAHNYLLRKSKTFKKEVDKIVCM